MRAKWASTLSVLSSPKHASLQPKRFVGRRMAIRLLLVAALFAVFWSVFVTSTWNRGARKRGGGGGSKKKRGQQRQLEGKQWTAAYFGDKTIIVGSGPSILENPLGEYIDLFKNVIRLNNFHLEPPSYTGKKVTHAVIHMATKEGAFHNIANKTNILFAPFEYAGQMDFLQKRVNKPSGSKLDLRQVTILPDYYYRGLADDMGIESGRHPLTGTIALAWAARNLNNSLPIYCLGFDLMFSNSTRYKHYQGDTTSTASLGKFHQIDSDRRYFQQLEHDGVLRRLDELPIASKRISRSA